MDNLQINGQTTPFKKLNTDLGINIGYIQGETDFTVIAEKNGESIFINVAELTPDALSNVKKELEGKITKSNERINQAIAASHNTLSKAEEWRRQHDPVIRALRQSQLDQEQNNY